MQAISRPRLAADRHENTAPADQRLEDPAVVRRETDAPQRAGEPELRQVARTALERFEQRAVPDRRADAGEVDALAFCGKHAFNQRRRFRGFFRENRHGVGGKAGLLQGVEPLGRPRNILKHSDREQSDVSLNHERVMYLTAGARG